MPQLLNRVQSGDLITAQMWNAAVDAINQLLLARPVAGVTVAATSPKGTVDDPILVGAVLQITGQNFGHSTGQTKVTFESPSGTAEVTRNQLLAGSSDTRLLLIVPPIPAMTETGLTMTLRVDSGVGSDARSVLVKPVVIPITGDMFVTWRADVTPNPKPNPLQASAAGATQAAEFALRLQTGINKPARFTLRADLKNASVAVPAGLVDSIEFLNENGTLIAEKAVEMATTAVRNVVVRIPALPASFAGQTFTLEVVAATSGVTGTFSRTFIVGTTVPATDPNIQPLRTGIVVFDPNGDVVDNPALGELAGTTIRLKTGHQMVVMYNLVLAGTAATYGLTIQPKQGSTLNGWTLALANTPATVPGPDAGRLVQFSVMPSGTAPSAGGTIAFVIKRQGATVEWFEEYTVELLP